MLPIRKIASRKIKLRMVDHCAVTKGAGKSSGSLLGCKTSAVCSRALIITLRITLVLCIWPASRFCCDAIYETASNIGARVHLWNVQTGQLLRTIRDDGYPVRIVYSPDGKTLASSSPLKLWDVESGKLQKTFVGHVKQVATMTFSPDGKTLASGDLAGVIKLWRVN